VWGPIEGDGEKSTLGGGGITYTHGRGNYPLLGQWGGSPKEICF